MRKAWISLWLLIILHLTNPSWAKQLRKLQIGSYAQNYIVKLPTVTNLAEGMILIFRRGFVILKVNNTMFQEGRLVKIHKREPILIKIRKNGRMFSKSYIVHNGWMKYGSKYNLICMCIPFASKWSRCIAVITFCIISDCYSLHSIALRQIFNVAERILILYAA